MTTHPPHSYSAGSPYSNTLRHVAGRQLKGSGSRSENRLGEPKGIHPRSDAEHFPGVTGPSLPSPKRYPVLAIRRALSQRAHKEQPGRPSHRRPSRVKNALRTRPVQFRMTRNYSTTSLSAIRCSFYARLVLRLSPHLLFIGDRCCTARNRPAVHVECHR